MHSQNPFNPLMHLHSILNGRCKPALIFRLLLFRLLKVAWTCWKTGLWHRLMTPCRSSVAASQYPNPARWCYSARGCFSWSGDASGKCQSQFGETPEQRQKPRETGLFTESLLLTPGRAAQAIAGRYTLGSATDMRCVSVSTSIACSLQLPQPDATPSSFCRPHKSVTPVATAERICLSVIALQMQTYIGFNAFSGACSYSNCK